MAKIYPSTLIKYKKKGEKIACITAYDLFTAHIANEVGFDLVLVGDSLSQVIQGKKDTLSVTLDEMIYHTKIVANVVEEALVVIDMPLGSYGISVEEGAKNAIRAIKESGAQAVKMEGAHPTIIETVKKLVNLGIPVMGHIGYTPQSKYVFGKSIKRGKDQPEIQALIEMAYNLQEAGAFAIVLESVEENLAERITKMLKIPTIGIFSGEYTDGQIAVITDILGMTVGYVPSAAKQYANLKDIAIEALSAYKSDIKSNKIWLV